MPSPRTQGLGGALTAIAEGPQRVPALQEQDEERQLRHQLRPLDLE
jgi:hypothetical protein